jgi:hypothetical protein
VFFGSWITAPLIADRRLCNAFDLVGPTPFW